MNEYIQDTIKELLRLLDVRIVDTSANYKKMEELYSEDLKNALQDAYNRGVEDALKQIPQPLDYRKQYKEWDEVMRTMKSFEELAHNNCRQQTIDNISKLLNNK